MAHPDLDGTTDQRRLCRRGRWQVAGQVAVHVFPFFERTGNTGRIVALVVDEQARRRGIGDHLMTAAESFAARHGLHPAGAYQRRPAR
ncbi:GNAT family N-acetyltransferase [Amycolatopsis sp. QT-25]|uniref:GNAT family N-acetyltransferase n=1 Tax=Amycolatopsis sp. QT-25 TaxID=3034022 RepID=UPI003207DE51